jgi:hypothetical protein
LPAAFFIVDEPHLRATPPLLTCLLHLTAFCLLMLCADFAPTNFTSRFAQFFLTF